MLKKKSSQFGLTHPPSMTWDQDKLTKNKIGTNCEAQDLITQYWMTKLKKINQFLIKRPKKDWI
jgi:hypothetical protein